MNDLIQWNEEIRGSRIPHVAGLYFGLYGSANANYANLHLRGFGLGINSYY